jgi:hypothetical protein
MDESLVAPTVPHYGGDNRLQDSDLSFLMGQRQEDSNSDYDTTPGPIPNSDGPLNGQKDPGHQELSTHSAANDMHMIEAEEDESEDTPVFGDAI